MKIKMLKPVSLINTIIITIIFHPVFLVISLKLRKQNFQPFFFKGTRSHLFLLSAL